MATFIDTHAHIYGKEFSEDLSQVISRAINAGATHIILPSTDLSSALRASEVAAQYPRLCYPCLGLHPEDIPMDYAEILHQMEKLLQVSNHFIAIGEVGLDYYWDDSRKELQQNVFKKQIEWSLHYNLPLIIHSRNAHDDLLKCLEPYQKEEKLRGIFHCFTGTLQDAMEMLTDYPSFLLGIGGISTFKKSTLPEVLPQIPLNRIVLETDSPYMAPVPHRGKRNEPSFIPYIAERLSAIYHTTIDEIENITTQNALSLFRLQ